MYSMNMIAHTHTNTHIHTYTHTCARKYIYVPLAYSCAACVVGFHSWSPHPNSESGHKEIIIKSMTRICVCIVVCCVELCVCVRACASDV
jgi:hypothetical protein